VDAAAYLDSLARFGMKLGLERMHALLGALENPQRELAAIHVVGTNGKSSTTSFCAAALGAQGLRVGAYLSPHVYGWHERIQVDGRPAAPEVFDEAMARVAAATTEVERACGEPPTQFEALTAGALLLLRDAAVEVAVVEAGLGGRLDSTNVLGAGLVGLTSIGIDHAAQLGEDPAAILREKLGVVGPGALVVCGPLDDELFEQAATIAGARGARGIRRLPADARETAGGALAGYLAGNAALALELARSWVNDAPFDLEAARAALPGAVPPGRLQLVPGDPPILLDGAHNPDGAKALAAALGEIARERRPRVAVVGLQEDKDAGAMASALRGAVDELVATSSGHPGSLTAAEAAGRLGAELVEPDPLVAIALARARAGSGGIVVVTGSIYLLERLAALHALAGATER